MAKKSNNSAPEMENGNVKLPEDLRPVQKDISILAAKMKDGSCLYVYKILAGVEKGRVLDSKKGGYLVKESLEKAFTKFNVHMACILDLFKNGGVEVDDIDKFHGHEYSFLMECSGFKIAGDEDNETIVLIGTMHVSLNARVKIETPKIPLDSLSSYKWYNELKTAADVARNEVELFKNGNYTIPEDMQEDEEEKEKRKKQTKIKFAPAEGEEPPSPEAVEDDIFDEGFDDEFGEARL